MKRRPASGKNKSPFDQVQRDLAAQEAKLKRDMEAIERQIAEAPARKQEQLKKQHNEILHRYEQRRGSDFFSSIPDKRFQYNTTVAATPRGKRKGEKRAAQLQFFALLALLIIAIFLVFKTLPW